MKGIYRFCNKINNKSYIGQSVDLDRRRKQHFVDYTNSNSHQFNTKFYRALRKYGWNNFNYEILYCNNEATKEELNYKERYYINYYDSFNNGYNLTLGGDLLLIGEKHPCATLSNEDVLQIKEELSSSVERSMKEIAEAYNTTQGVITAINRGINWKQIGDYINYPLRDPKACQRSRRNGNAKVSDEDVRYIRQLSQNNSVSKIRKMLNEKYSFAIINNIVMGRTYKNIL